MPRGVTGSEYLGPYAPPPPPVTSLTRHRVSPTRSSSTEFLKLNFTLYFSLPRLSPPPLPARFSEEGETAEHHELGCSLVSPTPPLNSGSAPHPLKPARLRGRLCHPPRRVARQRPYSTRQTQAALRHLTSITSPVSSPRERVLPRFRGVGRKSRPRTA